MHSLPWTVALTAALTLLGMTAGLWVWQWGKPRKSIVLPTVWALTARPVFSADERKVHRLLREALPNHVVLSKLPLVRFCQPTEPSEVRYWFDLLGATHVTFAVCSANGRVLAAIDLEADRGKSGRVMKIKQSVLTACRVRYLRCSIDHLPSAAELQLLVSSPTSESRTPQPAPITSRELHRVRDTASDTAMPHPAAHAALWHDSAMLRDSFFAPDTRIDSFSNSKLTTADGIAAARTARPPADLPAHAHSAFAPAPPTHSGSYDDIVIGAPRFSACPRP